MVFVTVSSRQGLNDALEKTGRAGEKKFWKAGEGLASVERGHAPIPAEADGIASEARTARSALARPCLEGLIRSEHERLDVELRT